MEQVIVVFSKHENAVNIRNILTRNGFDVLGVGTTGAQALQLAETCSGGVVVTSFRLQDMIYSELREYLPETFEILLIASADKVDLCDEDGVVGLPLPMKVHDLLNTVDMQLGAMHRLVKKKKERRRTRTEEDQRYIDEAKSLLMQRNGMTEQEAHKYLQRNSMGSGNNLVETARMILSLGRK
jgi:response regulator NasT